jgi:alpha-galactosidase
MRISMLLVICLSSCVFMGQEKHQECSSANDSIIAMKIAHEIKLDAQHPAPEWSGAQGVAFCADWQGKNADPERETQVHVLWTQTNLYLRFECRYRELTVFEDSNQSGRRDQLWDRDVAEVFLQPDPSKPRFYREIEIAPNGMWVDLDIFPGGLRDLKSGMQRSVWLNRDSKTWAAEIAIPMKALTEIFDSTAEWRLNFFRIEGPGERRFYSAWRATHTPQPNFHVPEAFGKLRFSSR